MHKLIILEIRMGCLLKTVYVCRPLTVRRQPGNDRSNYFRASNTRLNGVSVARRNCVKPADVATSRSASSLATAPSAGPPSAIELAVQQSVDAPENVRPIGLKFSSTVLP